jgi:hypothetical protein
MRTLVGPLAICGCGNQNISEQLQCCQVVDLGQVYEKEPEYSSNNPCKPTRMDVIIIPEEGEPYCESTPDEEPYGEVLDYIRACARLVVWTGAKIEGGSIDGQRYVLYSRQRNDLPQITEGECKNPIRCPAENEIYECCGSSTSTEGDVGLVNLQIGGPYNGCELIEKDDEPCELECSGETPLFKYGMSNCEIQTDDGKTILAGYAIAPDDWWFLGDDAFTEVENSIISNNPHGKNYQTIYAHFQVEWKPIRCKSRGGKTGSPCNGEGQINKRDGRCGAGYTQGLTEKEDREKAVKITAAIGYSIGGCGYDPETACSKLEEGQ